MTKLEELKNELAIISKEIKKLSTNDYIITYEELKEVKNTIK